MWPLTSGYSSGFGGDSTEDAALGKLNDFSDHSAPALFHQLLSCFLPLLGPCIQELQVYTADILTISHHICLHGNSNDNNKNPTKWENLVNQPPDLCLAGVIQTHAASWVICAVDWYFS